MMRTPYGWRCDGAGNAKSSGFTPLDKANCTASRTPCVVPRYWYSGIAKRMSWRRRSSFSAGSSTRPSQPASQSSVSAGALRTSNSAEAAAMRYSKLVNMPSKLARKRSRKSAEAASSRYTAGRYWRAYEKRAYQARSATSRGVASSSPASVRRICMNWPRAR